MLPQARRFTEVGVTAQEPLAELEPVTQLVRSSAAAAALENRGEREAAPPAGNAQKG